MEAVFPSVIEDPRIRPDPNFKTQRFKDNKEEIILTHQKNEPDQDIDCCS